MGWIKVEKSNFADEGTTVQFLDDGFICKQGEIAGLRLPATDIVFLNRQPKAQRVSGGTDTNILKYLFYGGGALLALIVEFFKFFGSRKSAKPRKKFDTKVIVKFKDDKILSGKTDFDTFFAIQNAWLDNK